ncbi:L-fuculokinase [Ancylomarina sp. 16SWW S1-10-2]|uniref:L-fuculokinase n=1 Tax=Ancylomarina sp. 16SWW S1-10-2 TaxID=2499681 RepID=UPI0012ADF509|nr:L-fuculokinase [Ancylomarina sp. 16SWW S1-10-2]MRT93821.1 L-fuculokinase [Ancylomarina sp. 16SWW S1-10-2]
MTQKDIAIVFDCGATNVRVIAMDKSGQILATHAMSNETDEDPHFQGGRIWDLEKLWLKLCKASKIVAESIDTERIAGITVTTFGVDGAFVDEKGELLYPVISWQCQRTTPIMDNIEKYIPLKNIYKISGVYPYAFNTINKFIWFKENRPEIIEQSHRFLFIPSLLINKLSGALQNDATMMGTAMMADLGKREFSKQILSAIGVDKDIFGPIAEPGDQVGEITKEAFDISGIPAGTPVFLSGHDTQFAIFGSGAQLNQPVLSSGTWEILMSRSKSFTASNTELGNNLTTELDAVAGLYNIGQNWLSSGVMEWFSKNFYSELSGDDLYETMIKEAELEMPGAQGVMVDSAFYDDGTSVNSGTITGLTISTRRSQLYRAFLESLSFRLREGLEALETAGNFKAERIICVGGGSKNRLWNQLRADVCNLPIQLIDQKETTVLGASMFVFAGAGVYKTANFARQKINYNPQVVNPSSNKQVYDQLYKNYIKFKK